MGATKKSKPAKGAALEGAALEARKAYQREWQRKNRDKVAAYKARYWARKAAGLVGQQETE